MDFLNRNAGQNGPSAQPGRAAQAPHGPSMAANNTPNMGGGMPPHDHHDHDHDHEKHSYLTHMPTWLRMANIVLLFSVTVLALAITLLLRNSNPNEGQYVNKDKYQAVFLKNASGDVTSTYFGKITALTNRYIILQNVFYLQNEAANSSTPNQASTNLTLKKLGCEVHGPYDQIVINRDQVTLWENLKDSSLVVKTIGEWTKQNPKGQECNTSTNNASQSSSSASSTTGSSSSSTSTNTSKSNGTSGQ